MDVRPLRRPDVALKAEEPQTVRVQRKLVYWRQQRDMKHSLFQRRSSVLVVCDRSLLTALIFHPVLIIDGLLCNCPHPSVGLTCETGPHLIRQVFMFIGNVRIYRRQCCRDAVTLWFVHKERTAKQNWKKRVLLCRKDTFL